MDGQSLNIVQMKLDQLREIMPEVFTEGQIDWEKLRLTLGHAVNTQNERYVLTWAGKTDAYEVLRQPTTATLIPAPEESINFETSQNIFIEGENLEVLKTLQKAYFGQIKMIYIDPPYNTGNDSFIYPDRFAESKEEYLKRIEVMDNGGYLLKEGLFRRNSKENGQFHSNWLSMLYPRLFLARHLLREDGVIFVSIDDNEVHNLRLMMNEVFGEENFIDCIIWKKRYGGGAKEKFLVSLHEYVLLYARNIDAIAPIFISLSEDSIKQYYKFQDENHNVRGPYRTHPLEATKSMGERKNLVFPIITPDGTEIYPKRQWLWSEERVKKALERGEIAFLKDKDNNWSVHTKQYLKDEAGEIRQGKAFSIVDDVYTQHGTNEIIEIFGNAQIMPFPKPKELIKKLINIGLTNGDNEGIVLDFFAGSATTAQAVLDLNSEDGGNRQFLCIQLAEKTEEDSPAYKAGYKTIADIAKERTRRAIQKIKTENPMLAEQEMDLGFKVFKLRPSNFKLWRGDGIQNGDDLERQLELFVDPVRPGAEEENMLYELLLKSGYPLTAQIEKVNGYYRINGGELVLVLSEISEAIVQQITAGRPQVCLILDRLFGGNDSFKTNTQLQMRDAGIQFSTI